MSEASPTEVLKPTSVVKVYEIGGVEFTQKPLTFFGKLELFSVLGGAIEKALNDVSVTEILDVPEGADDFADADAFIKAISKLVQYAPDFLMDIYLVALGVNRGDLTASEALQEMTDDQGFEILDTFLDQNGKVMVDFFNERIVPLVDKVGKTIRSESVPSKPSKRSPRNSKQA